MDRFLAKIEGNMKNLLLNTGYCAQLAATCIQKCYRGHKIRLQYRPVFVEFREKKAKIEFSAVLLLQTVFRRKFAWQELQIRMKMAHRKATLEVIRKRLAILTIRKLLYPKLIAVKRAEKLEFVRRRKRRLVRLQAFLQQKRGSRRLLGTAVEPETVPAASWSSKGEFRPQEPITFPEVVFLSAKPEISGNARKPTALDSDLEDMSSIGEGIVPIQPLGRIHTRRGYSRPTASSVERSLPFPSLTLPAEMIPTPAALPRSPHYLSGTNSSRLRSDPNYAIPVTRHKPLRSLSPNLGRYLQPTEAWSRYSTMRKTLFRHVNRGESRGKVSCSVSPRQGDGKPKTAAAGHRGQIWTNRALAELLPLVP